MSRPRYYYIALVFVCFFLVTSISYISVVTKAGHLSTGYEVSQLEHGSCEYGSTVLESSLIPVYMCVTHQSTYLTCWYLARSKRHTAMAVCLPLPWSKYVVEVSTTTVPVTPVHAGATTNLNWPWAVELTTGTRCLPGPGPGPVVSGLGIVDYYCGSPAFGLLNHADRAHALWTFKSVRESRSGRYVLAGQVTVQRAWFAGSTTPR
jgi:hypothetical protein